MWKLFSLALLATAAATSLSTFIDDISSKLSVQDIKKNPEFKEPLAIIENACNENGPKGAFKNFEQSAINTVFKLATALSSAIEKDVVNREVSNYVTIACRTIQNPAVKEQFEILNSNYEQCKLPKYRKYHWSPNKTIDIACKNVGERIIKFYKEGGVDCFNNQETNIYNCLDGSSEVFKDAENEFIYPKECRIVKKLKKCLREQLKHCLSTTNANFVEEMLVYDYPICKQTTAA